MRGTYSRPGWSGGIALLLLAGCIHRPQAVNYHTAVSSLARADAPAKKSYVLLPAENGVDPSDLQFLEYAGYVEKCMAQKGFVRAPSPEEADLLVFLGYGIGSPEQHVYSYSVPTWGQTGVSTSHTQGTVSSYGGMATYSGTTTYTPQYGITGATTHIGSYTTFTRFLFVEAIDAASYRQSQKASQVWKLSATSTGETGDLRQVFPYMAAASYSFFGTNSGPTAKIVLDQNDPLVMWLIGRPAPGRPTQ